MACKNWIKYNNNPKQKDVGDCVTRAIAKCTKRTWTDTFMRLSEIAVTTGYPHEYRETYEKLISANKYVKIPMQGSKFTVNQLAEMQKEIVLPNPRWLIRVKGHLTTIVEGRIYDTWDCGRRQSLALFVPQETEELVKALIQGKAKLKGMDIAWQK